MDDLVLTPVFNYYYVAHDVWGRVSGQIKNDSTRQLQYVPNGSSVYSSCGKSGNLVG